MLQASETRQQFGQMQTPLEKLIIA